MSTVTRCILIFLMSEALLSARMAEASDTINGITLLVKGTVNRPPPCVINMGNVIDVNFGEVLINRIQGDYYTVNVDYGLDCSAADNNMLTMSVSGLKASFGADLIETDVKNLGIRINNSQGAMQLTKAYPFDPHQGKVPITATLVKNGNVALVAGGFKATAMMTIDYL